MLCALCLLGASTCRLVGQTTIIEGTCFGPIEYKVTVAVAIDEMQAADLKAKVQQRLDEINAKMSTYLADSEVSRFNASKSLDWFDVDGETAKVVSRSLEISSQTSGAFDITVGPLVQVWKFGAAGEGSVDAQADAAQQSMPTAQQIETILKSVGYQKLEVRLDPPAIKKAVQDLQIDLSAVAKGYAVDQVALVTVSQGFENYFVQVGEEVRAAGKHPEGRDWVCGIEKPIEMIRVIEFTVPLVDQAIATSGDYRQFRLIGGKRYSHTIDPRTGMPSTSQVALASIAAADCLTADAFATGMMVLGAKESLALAQSLGLGLHLVSRDESGGLANVTNAAYPVAILPPAAPAGANWVVMLGITALVFGLALAGMSVGVMFKRAPIKGSCGGLASMPDTEGKSICDMCSTPSKECQENGLGSKAVREAAEAAAREQS